MNFAEFFDLIKIRLRWDNNLAYWTCQGCNIKFDKPAKKLHSSLNCSLSRLKTYQKIRQNVIEANLELYKKYCESKGIKIIITPKLEEDKPVPLSWYKKQIENLAKLSLNLSEPSGAETCE
jgi:hypothetical protein